MATRKRRRSKPLVELDRLARRGRYAEAIDLLARIAADLRTKVHGT